MNVLLVTYGASDPLLDPVGALLLDPEPGPAVEAEADTRFLFAIVVLRFLRCGVRVETLLFGYVPIRVVSHTLLTLRILPLYDFFTTLWLNRNCKIIFNTLGLSDLYYQALK